MKKLVILSMLSAMVLVSGCGEEKAPLTPEQQWQGYCKSIGNAARSIVLDRQNGITQKAAVDYANKVTDPTTKAFVLAQIEKVYALPADQLSKDKDAVQVKFKDEAYQTCIDTPFDPKKMPDYKQF
ncbi:hypothetical protein [Acinetobacter lanii]|uniref:Lipoprotein n=1 Tax=Acinetobacter lanii TaxID=2715163 RepID=A0A6G8S359_9GAMM|nr:hypothetical protein [Acinetobacter lanii]QIO08587.1 hypothetical protein G8D99_05845 [Acinetobacter lanii]